MSGRADSGVRFGGGVAWVLEIGVGGAGDAEKKLLQAQAYGSDRSEEEVLCGSVVVVSQASASAAEDATRRVAFAWSRRKTEEGVASWAWPSGTRARTRLAGGTCAPARAPQ